MTRFTFLFALGLGLAACGGPGRGVLHLFVDSDGVVPAIDHLSVIVENGGERADPVEVRGSSTPFSIPPVFDFTLSFHGRRGATTVAVAALDATGKTIAAAEATTELDPGKGAELHVTLPGIVVPDMGAPPVVGAPQRGFASSGGRATSSRYTLWSATGQATPLTAQRPSSARYTLTLGILGEQ